MFRSRAEAASEEGARVEASDGAGPTPSGLCFLFAAVSAPCRRGVGVRVTSLYFLYDLSSSCAHKALVGCTHGAWCRVCWLTVSGLRCGMARSRVCRLRDLGGRDEGERVDVVRGQGVWSKV